MQLTTLFTEPSTFPVVLSRPTKQKPANFLADIYDQLAMTDDTAEEARILERGLARIRRRERGPAKRRAR